MTKRSLETLQVGRAFAAIAVLLYHTEITIALPKYFNRSIAKFWVAGDSGVDFFFVLSGFVILFVHMEDIGNPKALGSYFWKRFRRIYPPLWIAILGLVLIFFFVPTFGTGNELKFSSVLSAFLLSPTQNEYLLGPEWTLRHEIVFYLLFGVIIWKPNIGILASLAWISLIILNLYIGLSYPWSFAFSCYNLLFVFGMVGAFCFRRCKITRPALALLAGFFIYAFTWMAVWVSILPKHNLATILYGIGATVAILAAAEIERTRSVHVPRLMLFLGEASYSIYLVHYPAISGACKILSKVNDRIILPDSIVFTATAAVALSSGIIFHAFVEKPLLRWISALRFMTKEGSKYNYAKNVEEGHF